MRIRQLSDLIADVRSLTDTQNQLNLVADSEITEWLNQGWTRVYGALALSGETYFLENFSFATVGGQPTYYTTSAVGTPAGTAVLPTDMWMLKGVDVQQNPNGYFLNAHRFEFEKRNDYQMGQFGGTWAWPARPLYDYQQMGINASLTFIPTPDTMSNTVKLWYFPAAVRLVNSTDTLDGGNGWERWAIAIAARWVALKDENYDLVSQLANEIAKWEADSKAEIASRNVEEAPQMRQVRYRRRGRGGGWPWGGGYF